MKQTEQEYKDELKAVELIEGQSHLTRDISNFFKNDLQSFLKKLTILSQKKDVQALPLVTTVIASIFRQVNKQNKMVLLQNVAISILNEDDLTEKSEIARELIKRMKAERERKKNDGG